jgi:hypothetical protein
MASGMFAVFGFFHDYSAAAEPVQLATATTPLSKYADPRTTYQTYIEAVRRCNPQIAARCWTIDDDNRSGALDTIVGMWIASRRVTRVTELRFGEAGLKMLGSWRREDVLDAALDLTEQRLSEAEVTITDDTAELKIKWQNEDGYPREAFEYSAEAIKFRKVRGEWKIDPNKMTDIKTGADFFAPGSWGVMFRSQVKAMNQISDAIETEQIKSERELSTLLEKTMIKLLRRDQ